MSTLVVVNHLADALRARGWMLATAESCTGGLIAAACTELAGSSDWFERGFVTYSNAAKHQMLGVDEALIRTQGAVSEPVALAMAAGALARSSAQLVVSVTGIAGPGGGSADKPVGLVWMATAVRGGAAQASCFRFAGDRRAVREAAVNEALGLLLVQAR
ncbi:MAG TPA: CinA family protein [Burkholderiaceae bacterium]|nr:CinA family protein [Burkholderiaceae bacterium]